MGAVAESDIEAGDVDERWRKEVEGEERRKVKERFYSSRDSAFRPRWERILFISR